MEFTRRRSSGHLRVQQYAQSMPISPRRVRRRRRSSIALLISREQLVTPQSKLSKILRVQFALLILSAIVVASVYYEKTIHYAQIILQWICDHPYEGSLVVMALPVALAVLGLPLSPIVCIGCGYAYFQQFGIPGVVAATVLSIIFPFKSLIYVLQSINFDLT